MKFFLSILILIFCLQSWTKADDISDFQIEGMSIGDSALDYFSKEEISKSNIYNFKKFSAYNIYKHPSFKVYEAVSFAFKKNDKTYKMHEVSGVIYYKGKNIKECFKKVDEISNEISELFNNAKEMIIQINRADKSGKSKVVDFNIASGESVRVFYVDWSNKMEQEMNYWDELKVSINSKEFTDFVTSKDYLE